LGRTMSLFSGLPKDIRVQAEANAFRSLVAHLQERPQVQNMELMTVSGFCRNCLSKWLLAGLREMSPLPSAEAFTYDEALHHVYAMPYGEWKSQYQSKATPEELERYQASKPLHAKHKAEALTPVPSTAAGGVKIDPCCPVDTAPVPGTTTASKPDSPRSAVQSAVKWTPAQPLSPPRGAYLRVGVLTVCNESPI